MGQQDKFHGQQEQLSDPGDSSEPVVKGEPFDACKYLYIGTPGTLLVKGKNDADFRPFVNASGWFPYRAVEVQDDPACTADDILAIY